MSSIPIPQFLKRLEKSRLLDENALERIRSDIDRVGPNLRSDALGRRLIHEGQLTEWHVQMLHSGKFAFFLGKYKLLDLLGYGGMGVVFKAEHSALGRIVAIKVLHKDRMKNPAVVARFHREIQAAATLNNPHVVIAYDADCVNDTHFLVMEYVDGLDLATIMERERKLNVEEACEYIRQAAVGLQHAHSRGMVHRDIKPSNLIVSRRDRDPLVKILDMGLARFNDDDTSDINGDHLPVAPKLGGVRNDSLTQIGQVMGTPDYMSPEQAWNTRAVDIRSDIYSLGCTLFLLLTGRFAFQGETATDKVLARTQSDPPAPSRYNPSVPAQLDAVVLRLMARDPANRYQTPAEVARALESFAVLPEEVLTVAGDAMPIALPIAHPVRVDGTAGSTVDIAAEMTLVDSPSPGVVLPVAVAVSKPESPPAADPGLDSFLNQLSMQATNRSRAATDAASAANTLKCLLEFSEQGDLPRESTGTPRRKRKKSPLSRRQNRRG